MALSERSSVVPSTSVLPSRRIADQVLDALARAGVTTVFGVPGGAVVPFFDALYDRPEIRLVCPKHEAGAMFAAAGYARSSGRLTAVFVTSGPGLLNTLNGLATAHLDGAPLLLIAGDVATNLAGRHALQDGSAHGINVRATTASLCLAAFDVPNAGAAMPMLHQAIAIATSGRRGPVVLNVPLDVASAVHAESVWASPATTAKTLPADAIRDAARALAGAKRPVIFAGSGVRRGTGAKRLADLAEHLQVPVMTTPKGKGVFSEAHPLSLGVFGHGGHVSSQKYLEAGIDAVLVVGSSLSDPATNGWSDLLRQADTFIQVDVSPSLIGRNYVPTHVLLGECEDILPALLAATPKSTQERKFGVALQRSPQVHAVGDSGLITPERAIHELSKALPEDAVFSIDIGEHLIFGTHYLRTTRPDGFLAMTGLASMGTSIGAAMGAQLAHPDRKVVALCGDGCFLMAVGDIASAAQEGLPIIVAVLNDERYGMVELGTQALYGRTREYPIGPVDIVTTARGLGAAAHVVTKPDELQSVLAAHTDARKPLVLDIRIDRSSRMARSARFDSLLKTTKTS
ncbi:MAG: thiamine pyrophosphate-binding protein [Myxococcota bacterium]